MQEKIDLRIINKYIRKPTSSFNSKNIKDIVRKTVYKRRKRAHYNVFKGHKFKELGKREETNEDLSVVMHAMRGTNQTRPIFNVVWIGYVIPKFQQKNVN